ncbi:hypothetical protein COLO4_32158 [Corchorus olitorius]|uniref:Uncharacterized protein n=1 Tax=Corchorus olitorius TaxID=93759 RepID=A0A1R3H0R7_9ROSI|nr:hypothetical protein COLO4_32158 [Corchorus olitorius]
MICTRIAKPRTRNQKPLKVNKKKTKLVVSKLRIKEPKRSSATRTILEESDVAPNGIFPPLQHDIQPYLSKLLTHHFPPCMIPACRVFWIH